MNFLLQIDPHSGVPVYRQLMDQIRLLRAGGILQAGQELPSTRQLSVELGINPMTVSKAYSLLEAEGTITRQRGQPCRVAGETGINTAASRQVELDNHLRPALLVAHQLGFTSEEILRRCSELTDSIQSDSTKK